MVEIIHSRNAALIKYKRMKIRSIVVLPEGFWLLCTDIVDYLFVFF